MKKYYLGVDLGGTKISIALADINGKIVAKKKVLTEADQGRDRVLLNIVRTSEELVAASKLSFAAIERMAIGVPGWVNVETGLVHHAPNLKWENVPITSILQKQMDVHVVIENDANAAALGECVYGAGKGALNLLYITISTGIGGGIIINGQLHRGNRGRAGEIGHMIINPSGPRCGCGNSGCLEAFSSGTAIARKGKEAVERRDNTLLIDLCQGDSSKVTAALVSRAAKKGDKVAREILNEAGYYLGIGIANLINLLGPDKVILGGGVLKAEDLVLETMKDTILSLIKASSLDGVEICKAALGDESGVVGALVIAMSNNKLRNIIALGCS